MKKFSLRSVRRFADIQEEIFIAERYVLEAGWQYLSHSYKDGMREKSWVSSA